MLKSHNGQALRMYWCDEDGLGRNVFCVFERRVVIAAPARTASVAVFADSLFRLSVNGTILGYGPARFHPDHPECDIYDLAAHLRVGENILRVEVHSRGTDCYQAMPGRGGLALTGGVDGESLDLPDGWKVARPQAWAEFSEDFSFAQGPVEICDTRLLGGREMRDPVERRGRALGMSVPPRSIPAPSLIVQSPVGIVRAGPLSGDRFRAGFRCRVSPRARQPFLTHIFSDKAQTVVAGVFWGPVGVNGVWLEHSRCGRSGNREETKLELRAGWNFVFGMPEALSLFWPWQMDFPINAGLILRADPNDAGSGFFRLGPGVDDGQLPERPTASCGEIENIREWVGVGGREFSPARELAWDIWEDSEKPAPQTCRWPLIFDGKGDFSVVFDFGGQYLGHAGFDVEAPAGMIVDVGYEERLKADGSPDYFLCHPLVNSADRFVLNGGRRFVEAFHERGGRYLQLTFRDAGGPVRIFSAGVRSSCGDYPRTGAFECGDADLDWAWKAGEATLRSSMADGWIDPWRERGLYIGDALVEGHATRKITSDWRMDPWCLRLWARSQFPDGQLPDVVPSTPHRPLCDYTLLWVVALRNYWAASGDVALARELWPTVVRIFESPVWTAAEGGLWTVTPDMKIFVDWGVVAEERMGVNAALNAFRYHALESAGELAAALGEDSDKYIGEAGRVAAAFRDYFWIGQRFTAALLDKGPFPGPAYHANALALAFGLCPAEQTESVAEYVLGGLDIAKGFAEGHLEIYFLYFALEGLYRCGRIADAENTMRAYYGLMRRGGAWTLWERLREGMQGKDSMCHGWSTGAMPYLSEHVLGVRPAKPGDPSVMLVAPESETLDHASGIVPHPAGPISVRWAVNNNALQIDVEKPVGIEIVIQPKGRLAGMRRIPPKTV